MLLATPLALAALSVAPSGSGELETFVLDEGEPAGWNYEVRPYLWFPALDVTTMIDTVNSGSTRKNISDLFDDLEPGFMVAFEAAPEDATWGLMFDLSWVDVSGGGSALSVDAAHTFLEVDAYVQTPDLPGTDLFLGLRFIELDTTVVNGPARSSDSDVLIDPVIGARAEIPLGDKWTTRLLGSVSGFGFGTDLTWLTTVGFSYAFGDGGGEIDLGWRVLDIKYDDDYDLEARYSGPMLGLIWGF